MNMAGRIEDGGLVEFLRAVTTLASSGRLEIESGEHAAQIILRRGRLVAAITDTTPRLGEILTDAGVITERELDGVLAIQKRKKVRQPLGMILVQLGVLKSDRLEVHLQGLRKRAVSEILSWQSGTYSFTTEEESDLWGRDPGGLRLDDVL